MNKEFMWDEKYSVGNPDIDAQHKSMIELANSLSEDRKDEDNSGIIRRLYKHIREHFEDEENMMAKIGYPKLTEHKEHHKKLITELHKMNIRSFENENFEYNFKEFIYNWVTDHILNHDKDYFRFTQEKITSTASRDSKHE
ncbi:MAG: bacteriohemerythrin [Fidelibacterota bacterium]